MRTQAFQLNYSKAADMAVQLTGTGSSRILTTRGSVIAEPRTNQLFVTDVPTELDQVALDTNTVSDTLGILLKYQDDIAAIGNSKTKALLDEVKAELAAAE